jgi:hypothetical protein
MQWTETYGGSSTDVATGVVTDDQDGANMGIYVCGYFESKAFQFGSTQLTLPPLDQRNMFVAKLDFSVKFMFMVAIETNSISPDLMEP